jgi:uncharacterized protein (DUF169 family)
MNVKKRGEEKRKFGVEIKQYKERKIAGDWLEMATKQKSCRWCKSVKEGRRGERGAPLYGAQVDLLCK